MTLLCHYISLETAGELIGLGCHCSFVCSHVCSIETLWENSCSHHHETLFKNRETVGLCRQIRQVAAPAVGCEVRFAVAGISCYTVCQIMTRTATINMT